MSTANFTWEIKRELLQAFPREKEGLIAALSAFLNTAGGVSKQGEVFFVSENERVAEYFLHLTEVLGLRMELGKAVYDPKRKRDKLMFVCSGADAAALLSAVSPQTDVMRFARTQETALCYLRAAFLGGGSCTLPRGGAKTGYHLEFVFGESRAAEDFSELLGALQLLSKLVDRGEKYVIYCKSREIISDFLSVVGARGALKRLETVTAQREESNNFNRVSNCYAGNADKSAIASAAQVLALGRMAEDGILATLQNALKETAECRMQNPADSLSELAEKLGISKSCCNHRLRKLMALYDISYKR